MIRPKGLRARLLAPTAGLILALIFLVRGPAVHQALAATEAPQQAHVEQQAAALPGPVYSVATATVAAVVQQQDVPLPENTLAIIAAILAIAGGIWSTIVLTGLGKFLAERFGIHIEGNQVRALAAGAATVVCVVAGLLAAGIPGVPALPLGEGVDAWLRWFLMSAAPLTLFSTAVWKYAYKPEPPVIELPAVLNSTQ